MILKIVYPDDKCLYIESKEIKIAGTSILLSDYSDILLGDKETIYIMNNQGKTIDTIYRAEVVNKNNIDK